MRTIAHAASVETNAFSGASISSLSMGWFTTHATDDLGNTVELVVGSAGLAKDDPELASVLVRYAESIQPRSGIPAITFIAVTAGVLTVVIGTQLLPTSLPPWFASLTVGPLLLFALLVITRAARQRHTSRLVESVLRIGRCPGCGYNLRAAPPASDSICRCPECAAGWRVDRVGRAAVPAAELPPVPDTPGDSTPLFGTWASLLARNPTIIDDRDRCFPRVDLAFPGVDAELGAAGAARLRAEASRTTRNERIAGSVVALLFVTLFGWRAVMLALAGAPTARDALLALATLMPCVVYAVFLIKIWNGRTRWSTSAVSRTAKEYGVCPSCGGSMASTNVEPDGCRICPKCYAAWKMPNSPHASSRTTTSV